MELKARIPNEAALESVLLADISATTKAVKKEIGQLEVEYVSYRRKQRLLALSVFSLLFLPSMFFFIFGSLLSATVSAWSGLIGTAIFFASICVFVFVGYKLFSEGAVVIKAFHKGIDRILFDKIFSLLGVTGKLIEHTTRIDERIYPDTKRGRALKLFNKLKQLTTPSPESIATINLLRQSELITEPFNTSKVDNLFSLKSPDGSREMTAGELDIKNITGGGKNRQVKNIFKGYFVSYELPHTLDAKTFVSTDGDRSGFGHLSFWSTLKESVPKETLLEWNEFEDLLHVATTDKAEARYILTPDFMQDLHSWWVKHEANIRISFIGNYLYLLFPDDQIRLKETVANIDETEVKNYMLTIARPLLHILHLIEDVRMS